MELHINDVFVLKEILNRVVKRDYDLIEDREVNALLELCNEEYAAFEEKMGFYKEENCLWMKKDV